MSAYAGDALPGLAQRVMRRASVVAVAVMALALLLGLVQLRDDVHDEVEAGMHLAEALATLAQASAQPQAAALEALRDTLARGQLRHLRLQVLDEQGRTLLSQGADAQAGPTAWLRRHLVADAGAEPARQWALARPGGPPWTVRLSPARDGELHEALASLVVLLVLLLLCVAGLLVSMRLNVAHSLRPLSRLAGAMAALGQGDTAELLKLPRMPVAELEQMAQATRALSAALQQAQGQRRLLSRKMHSLQERERAQVAQELHDELGQRLTALRVGLASLERRLPAEAPARPAVAAMLAECELLQREVRLLMAGLQPFGPAPGPEGSESIARLTSLLQALVLRWGDPSLGAGLQTRLHLVCTGQQGQAVDWPSGIEAEALHVPKVLALVLYRISQESLTNVARHAQARHAHLHLALTLGETGEVASIAWAAVDDGVGLARPEAAEGPGHGLAGIQQRIWAVGGELTIGPGEGTAGRPGLRLSARIDVAALRASVETERAARLRHAGTL